MAFSARLAVLLKNYSPKKSIHMPVAECSVCPEPIKEGVR
jgi:hypothetical protein